MEKQKFQRLMTMAKSFQEFDTDRADFWRGFQRGLRRLHHGENFGTAAEHDQYMNCADGEYRKQLQTGYRAGFYRKQYSAGSGSDIGNLRKLLKLSVSDIAEIAAVSPRTVEGWEQGRPMSEAARQLICKYLMI